MRERHLLITGGAGYIGSHTAWEAQDAGYRVTVLDNLQTGSRHPLPAAAHFVAGDLGDRQDLQSLFAGNRFDAVLHLAASTSVPESVADPLLYYRNNLANSIALLEATLQHGVPFFIFSSTCAVYAPTADGKVAETSATGPLSPYGTSKLLFEQVLRDLPPDLPLRHCCLRYFNVAGADPRGRTGQSNPQAAALIKRACRAAVHTDEAFTIFGDDYDTPDGTGVRDYIHVSDIARAHLDALEHLRAQKPDSGRDLLLNCGIGHGYSVKEVLDTVAQVAGAPLRVTTGPRREGDIAKAVAVAQRIRDIGWTPRHSDLRYMVETALSWEQSLAGNDS